MLLCVWVLVWGLGNHALMSASVTVLLAVACRAGVAAQDELAVRGPSRRWTEPRAQASCKPETQSRDFVRRLPRVHFLMDPLGEGPPPEPGHPPQPLPPCPPQPQLAIPATPLPVALCEGGQG